MTSKLAGGTHSPVIRSSHGAHTVGFMSTQPASRFSLPWRAAVAGALAAGVAIAASELVAGVVRGTPSLVTSIGSLAISLQPPGAKDLMVSLFGTNDKLALNIAVVAVAVAVAAVIGIAAGAPAVDRGGDHRRVRGTRGSSRAARSARVAGTSPW